MSFCTWGSRHSPGLVFLLAQHHSPATTTVPIVSTGSDDPVGFGLVASLNKPGGNVTDVSLFTSELEVKRFALLRELALLWQIFREHGIPKSLFL